MASIPDKILMIGIIGLLIIVCISYVYYDSEEQVESIDEIEFYSEKEITYAPIECFINETHYDIKCYEDYINGN